MQDLRLETFILAKSTCYSSPCPPCTWWPAPRGQSSPRPRPFTHCIPLFRGFLPCCGPEVQRCWLVSCSPLAGQTVFLLYVCILTKLFKESHHASTGNDREHLLWWSSVPAWTRAMLHVSRPPWWKLARHNKCFAAQNSDSSNWSQGLLSKLICCYHGWFCCVSAC